MEKCAAVIINDFRLLVVRKQGTSIFISPGGKIEDDENQVSCLRRELKEELNVELMDAQYLTVYERPSALENMPVRIYVWLVTISGECTPSAEIEEIQWITGSTSLQIGSVFSDCVIPDLIKGDLIHA